MIKCLNLSLSYPHFDCIMTQTLVVVLTTTFTLGLESNVLKFSEYYVTKLHQM